ncbi:MAG: phasin family protein [Pseudomonadota bacterium]|nr:phasin family protein [Pseudomonadota bacterium]
MEISTLARKFMLLGIGALSLTEERLEQIISGMVKKGEISSQEGRDLVQEMLKKIKQEKGDLSEKIKKEFNSLMDKVEVPKQSEIDELKQRIAELEAKLEQLHPAE